MEKYGCLRCTFLDETSRFEENRFYIEALAGTKVTQKQEEVIRQVINEKTLEFMGIETLSPDGAYYNWKNYIEFNQPRQMILRKIVEFIEYPYRKNR